MDKKPISTGADSCASAIMYEQAFQALEEGIDRTYRFAQATAAMVVNDLVGVESRDQYVIDGRTADLLQFMATEAEDEAKKLKAGWSGLDAACIAAAHADADHHASVIVPTMPVRSIDDAVGVLLAYTSLTPANKTANVHMVRAVLAFLKARAVS
ncbi:hypothetical protein LUX29_21435 [Aureimonas altamirensis]|uniref:hypothetical protein n=1 Tax=Aureimonas altamirensis TaxID=370622 RepID=UPI001E3463F6|nr:hypothetical protein [Aureimonas altamirensis]UHD45518.1 hypothetical protein LUX29_21435 [Aureimonas altamirensis]